jgi:vacuolar iron transporter family protein
MWLTIRCGRSLEEPHEKRKRQMPRPARKPERHAVGRLGWLRAAVLGANDGILSTSSLIIGVASAHGSHQSVLIAGVAGLVAGAMSMASGEYVSVSSQADSESADIAREGKELREDAAGETRELAAIYVKRGLDSTLAQTVAEQLMARDALGAHTRDELGISDITAARPIQAALASAAAFSAGGLPPLLIAAVTPAGLESAAISIASLGLLVALGAVGAKAGGANMIKASARVVFWGALAMAITAGIGAIFGTHV